MTHTSKQSCPTSGLKDSQRGKKSPLIVQSRPVPACPGTRTQALVQIQHLVEFCPKLLSLFIRKFLRPLPFFLILAKHGLVEDFATLWHQDLIPSREGQTFPCILVRSKSKLQFLLRFIVSHCHGMQGKHPAPHPTCHPCTQEKPYTQKSVGGRARARIVSSQEPAADDHSEKLRR